MGELLSGRRPNVDAQTRVEERRYQNKEHRPFDECDTELAPPEWRLAGNFVRGKMGDVDGFRFVHHAPLRFEVERTARPKPSYQRQPGDHRSPDDVPRIKH